MRTLDGSISAIDLNINTCNYKSTHYVLFPNYPNPFNPTTTIKYSIPKQSNVKLKIFDLLGSEVKTLVNKEQNQGNYRIEFDGKDFTSGIYFYKIYKLVYLYVFLETQYTIKSLMSRKTINLLT